MRIVRRLLPWLAASLAACVHAGRSRSSDGTLAITGNDAARTVVAEPTTSLALDRITKRQPVLNGVARHAGTGRGVTVYVFDGGIDAEHPELAGRVRIGFDAFPSVSRICNSHGTAVAGAIAGATLGVARDAEVVDVKIIDCRNARGSGAAVLAGARWAVQDHLRHGRPSVANWSFVVDTVRSDPAVDSAAALLLDAGIVVVASAGNFDLDACRVSPANSPRVMAVGASTLTLDSARGVWRDVRSAGTAYGPCVDLYAPGDSVLLPTIDGGRSAVALWRGTSMAAGYVSGAATLVLERYRAAAPKFVIATLMKSSTAAIIDERRPAAARRPCLYIGGVFVQ
jgi:subtilisin family serine protease